VRDQEQETREELLRYLEQVTDRTLRTREDMDRFLAFFAEVHPEKEHREALAEAWMTAKRLVLVALAAFALFQYFAVEAVTEVLSTDKVKFLTPPPLPPTNNT
jgi:hypothetical protein